MVSQIFFLVILANIALQRLLEMNKSRRNERALIEQGGREHAPGHFIIMVTLHTTWFASMILEVFWFDRPFYMTVFLAALLFTIVGNWLRFQSMKALGSRWTVRILTLPGSAPVTTGIYRYVRHPIYLGVMLEITAVPLLHTAYLTSIIFSIANAMLLKKRITEEEKALTSDNDYTDVFADKPSLLPNLLYRNKT